METSSFTASLLGSHRFVVHGLTTGETYVFRVQAINELGLSDESQESAPLSVRAALSKSAFHNPVCFDIPSRNHLFWSFSSCQAHSEAVFQQEVFVIDKPMVYKWQKEKHSPEMAHQTSFSWLYNSLERFFLIYLYS